MKEGEVTLLHGKQLVKQLLITILEKKIVFHNADYDKINEYFSTFKWEDIFQNRNANECWMKFLEIAKRH